MGKGAAVGHKASMAETPSGLSRPTDASEQPIMVDVSTGGSAGGASPGAVVGPKGPAKAGKKGGQARRSRIKPPAVTKEKGIKRKVASAESEPSSVSTVPDTLPDTEDEDVPSLDLCEGYPWQTLPRRKSLTGALPDSVSGGEERRKVIASGTNPPPELSLEPLLKRSQKGQPVGGPLGEKEGIAVQISGGGCRQVAATGPEISATCQSTRSDSDAVHGAGPEVYPMSGGLLNPHPNHTDLNKSNVP